MILQKFTNDIIFVNTSKNFINDMMYISYISWFSCFCMCCCVLERIDMQIDSASAVTVLSRSVCDDVTVVAETTVRDATVHAVEPVEQEVRRTTVSFTQAVCVHALRRIVVLVATSKTICKGKR